MSTISLTKDQFLTISHIVDTILQNQESLLQLLQSADNAATYQKYDYLNIFMPEWGRSTVASLQKLGYINGTEEGKYDLSEDLLRLLVFFDRGNIGNLANSSYLEIKNKFDDYFARIAKSENSTTTTDTEGNIIYPAIDTSFTCEDEYVVTDQGYNISFNIVNNVTSASTNKDDTTHWRFKYAGNAQFDTIEQIYGYFNQRGFSVAAICGLLGNALQECGNQKTFLISNCLNPKAIGIEVDGTKSRGLWQFNEKSFPDSRALGSVWEQCELLNDRIAREFQVYGSNFSQFLRKRNDANASKYQNFNLETYKKMTDPGYAALAFCVVFERCADQYVLPRGHLGWVALNELFEQK